jgi:hypothetical protein
MKRYLFIFDLIFLFCLWLASWIPMNIIEEEFGQGGALLMVISGMFFLTCFPILLIVNFFCDKMILNGEVTSAFFVKFVFLILSSAIPIIAINEVLYKNRQLNLTFITVATLCLLLYYFSMKALISRES